MLASYSILRIAALRKGGAPGDAALHGSGAARGAERIREVRKTKRAKEGDCSGFVSPGNRPSTAELRCPRRLGARGIRAPKAGHTLKP